MLLILIGTFTIIPSFGQVGNLDWNQICNTVTFALYNSCDVYVNSFGQLTFEGERAMGCIRNGLLLGGGAAAIGTPLEMIIPGLDILAGMTGCDGIVKLDLLSSLGNPNQILNMFTQMSSQNGFINTLPQNYVSSNTVPENDINENTIPENDINENTIPENEFVNFTNKFSQFTNDLYSIDYPSHWEYYEGLSNDSNLYFYDQDNPSEHVVIIGAFNTVVKDFDIVQFLLSRGLGDDINIGITDTSKENVYFAGYPAIKLAGTWNSEIDFILVITSVNNKTYVAMSFSKDKYPLETNYIFERMISSFNIFSTGTTNFKSFENNDHQYSWNWGISDGVLTYKVNSSDVKFRNMVDSAFNEWEAQISPLIVFEKIKYGTANITFNQVQNLTTYKSDNREIEIDNGTTIMSIISNSSLIDNVNINIVQDFDVKNELKENAVIKHQIGHALGLKHTDNITSIMHQYPSVNYSIKEITLCDAYKVHIINFGKDSDSPIDENACNTIENNQSDFSNILPQNNQTMEDFSLYENSTFGIKINYLKNWTIESQKEEYPLTNVAIFYSPENKDYVEVHIYTYDYSNTQIDTLGELLNDTIASFTLPPNDFPEFKLLRTSTDKHLADMPAYVLEGHYKDPEFGKQMILEQGMIKDNINYYIRYFASPSQYLNYLDDVEIMIDSFKIQKEDRKSSSK